MKEISKGAGIIERDEGYSNNLVDLFSAQSKINSFSSLFKRSGIRISLQAFAWKFKGSQLNPLENQRDIRPACRIKETRMHRSSEETASPVESTLAWLWFMQFVPGYLCLWTSFQGKRILVSRCGLEAEMRAISSGEDSLPPPRIESASRQNGIYRSVV